jgi:hypothetical protein
MAGVVAIVSAQQVGSAGADGVVVAPLPGLGSSVWVPSNQLGFNREVIGADASAMYIRNKSDSTSGDYAVTRVNNSDGSDLRISGIGADVGGSLGPTYLVLPVGELDAILFGRDAISRIQGDDELWRIPISGQSGWVMADAAVVAAGVVTVVYQRADFTNFRPIDYRAFSFSLDSPPTATVMSTWPLYGIDWDAVDATSGEVTAAGFITTLAPTLGFGVAVKQVRSGDGWFVERQHVLTGAFSSGGVPTTSYYGNFYGASTTLSTHDSSIVLSGNTIVGGTDVVAALPQTPSDIILPPLDPGNTTWSLGDWFRFGLSFGPPPPVPPFWTNLRRAAESI